MTTRFACLLDGVAVREVRGDIDVDIGALSQDSRDVGPQTLFCCIRGARRDGHDLAADAVAGGAVALLVDHPLRLDVPQAVVDDVRAAVGPIAASFYGHPSTSMTVVGVTGTNGKTTTTELLRSIFDAAEQPCAVIGTLGGERTTPEAIALQRLLADCRDKGKRAVAMEVSSIALDQRRTDGVEFDAAIWTNLSQDHLDYHATMEAYFEAKARLFTAGRVRVAVLNADDPYGARLVDRLEAGLREERDPSGEEVTVGRVPDVVTYRLADAFDADIGLAGSTFRWHGEAVRVRLGGRHNVANALGAATAALALGIDPATIARGLESVHGVAGRWEVIDEGQPFAVLVDYAHTPDGLEQVLAAVAGARPGGRVIVVFGCGGDRDRSKRPEMAAVATRFADLAVLTSDNPRSEDPMAIIREAAAGAERVERLLIEPDRAAAIAGAIGAAGPGDVVVIAGKGHEIGQEIGDAVVPFDDRHEARRSLRSAGFGDGR